MEAWNTHSVEANTIQHLQRSTFYSEAPRRPKKADFPKMPGLPIEQILYLKCVYFEHFGANPRVPPTSGQPHKGTETPEGSQEPP